MEVDQMEILDTAHIHCTARRPHLIDSGALQCYDSSYCTMEERNHLSPSPVSTSLEQPREFPNAKDSTDVRMLQVNSTTFSVPPICNVVPLSIQADYTPSLPLSLEPARRSCDGNRLVHHPFADS
jgi:hypothetical protein